MRKFFKVIGAATLVALLVGFSASYIIKAVYPLKYEDCIRENSAKYDLDPFFVMGVISAESRFSEDAVSNKDAKGLMQLKDETANWCAKKYGIDGPFYETYVNIEIGCAYLRYLLDLFDGSEENALAAYNAGQGNVKKWLADEKYSSNGKNLDTIPYTETREYVVRVLQRENIYRKIYG